MTFTPVGRNDAKLLTQSYTVQCPLWWEHNGYVQACRIWCHYLTADECFSSLLFISSVLISQEATSDKLYEISVQEEVTARLHFIKFENAYIETCLDFIKDHLVNTETKVIKATGGGAHKFKELIERKLGLK